MRCRDRSDRGTVTVEIALAMPVLFAVLGVVLWAVTAAGIRMDCVDAARAGARAAARGDSEASVRALVERTGPPGARLEMHREGRLVTVTVRARTAPPGPFRLPAFPVAGAAVAEVEQ
jgi:hypothetical protein